MTELELITVLEKIKYAIADNKVFSEDAKVRAYFDLTDAIEQLRKGYQG